MRKIAEYEIVSGESLSGAVEIAGGKTFGVQLPDTWDHAGLSFRVSGDSGEFSDLHRPDGAEYMVAGVPGGAVPLEGELLKPWRYLKVRSGSSGKPVAQSGLEAVAVIPVAGSGDTTKTLTFLSGVGGPDANNLEITIETNTTDDLAASIDGYHLLIKLASQTAAKNAADLIEDAVQALAATGEVDLTNMTVTGNGAYNDAPPVGVAASITVTVAEGKTLTFASVVKGAAYNGLSVSIETADDDELDVSNPEDTGTILVKLAKSTAGNNEAADIQTALQALGTVGGLDVSGMTVAASAGYTSAPPAGVKASKAFELDEGKTLTVTAGDVGPAWNGLKFTFGVNEDETDSDALSVAKYEDTVIILLADTTPARNAAAAIEVAVRLLGTVGDLDVSAVTVEANAGYADAPPVALGDGVEILEVPLAGGADAIASGVVEDVPFEGGADSIASGVVNGVELTGGDNCRLKLVFLD